MLCAVSVFTAPKIPGKVGIKVIDEISPAPKGSIAFAVIPDSYTEESKQIEYEEYGIKWLYTNAKLDVFKTIAEVRAFYKLRGSFIEKHLESGDIVMTTGNKADFKIITISSRNNFCLVTLEHVRPTPEALKELGIVTSDSSKTVKPTVTSAPKPVVKRVNRKPATSKNTVVKKTDVKKVPVKKAVKKTVKSDPVVVHQNIKITDKKTLPADIIKEAPAPKHITPVKKTKSNNISGIKKVAPKAAKPKVPAKEDKPFFEG